MSDKCPKCGSTDIGDVVDSNFCTCLDCDFLWLPKARRSKKYDGLKKLGEKARKD